MRNSTIRWCLSIRTSPRAAHPVWSVCFVIVALALPASYCSAQTDHNPHHFSKEMDAGWQAKYNRALRNIEKQIKRPPDRPWKLYDASSGAVLEVLWPKTYFQFLVLPGREAKECTLIALSDAEFRKLGIDFGILEQCAATLRRSSDAYGTETPVGICAVRVYAIDELERVLGRKISQIYRGRDDDDR